MKKSLFTLAALATVMASCSDENVLVDNGQQDAVETAIGFGTFAQKATRAENSSQTVNPGLYPHHHTFEVWGYKDVTDEFVFGTDATTGTVVTGAQGNEAVLYSATDAATHNAALSGAVSTSTVKTPAVTYTQADIDAARAIVTEGTGGPNNYSTEDVAAAQAIVTAGVGAVKTSAEYYTQAEADAYNATLTGAVKEGDIKTPATDTWSYSPVRFWDKNANSYEFYAAAPAEQGWVLNDNSTVSTHSDDYFTLPERTLKDATLPLNTSYSQSMAADKKANDAEKTHDNSGNVDLMIASPRHEDVTASMGSVDLDFNHILSRLNITVKKGTQLNTTDASDANVALDRKLEIVDLEVRNMVMNGAFDETQANAVPGNTAATASYGRWTRTNDSKNTYTANKIAEVANNTTYYILQSLIMPQGISYQEISRDGREVKGASPAIADPAPYLYIKYMIGSNRYKDVTSTIATDASVTSYYVLDNGEYKKATGTKQTGTTYYKLVAKPETFEAYYNLAALFSTGYTYAVKSNPSSISGLYEQDANDATKFNQTTDTTVDSSKTYYERKAGILAFNEGWQNNLNLTIDVDVITFTANAYNWANGATDNKTIK